MDISRVKVSDFWATFYYTYIYVYTLYDEYSSDYWIRAFVIQSLIKYSIQIYKWTTLAQMQKAISKITCA